MSTTAPARTAGSYAIVGPTATGAARRIRSLAPWLAILVLGALALVALGASSPPEGRLLDPRSPAPQGSRAVAEVLRTSGVGVSIVTSLVETPTGAPGTTVVVTADGLISGTALTEVATRSAGADRLVVLLARPEAVAALSAQLAGYPLAGAPSAPAARCAIPGVRPGDVVTGGSALILPTPGTDPDSTTDSAAPTLCFAAGSADSGGLLALLPATGERPETVLVGFAGGLTNGEITAEDNAAVALRLLGQSPRLTWLIPGGIDTLDGPGSPDGASGSPWPAWTTPAALILAGGTVLLALVRGRRLGRLVPEPLPVIVRAAETTESRAHLYRRSRDLHRTATILRAGTRARLRRRLGVAATDPSEGLFTAVSAATGEPLERIQQLLGDAEPTSNADLIALGSDLADLERKVHLS